MAEEIEIIVTATGFDKVSSGLKNTTDALKTTATEAKKTGDAMRTNLNNGAAQAGQSITNLSRIVQDAPFGFIGIANNINPLVESFGRLKAESGSTGGALKALVSGLSGPAGLGLAFGVVTSAITFAQMGFQAWTRGSKEAKENSDLFKKDLERLKAELKAVTDELNSFINVAENSAKLNDINIVARFEDKTQQGVLQRQARFITISEELVKATDARRKALENLGEITRKQFKTDEEYNQAYKAALDVYNQTIAKENELINARELQAATNRAATVEDKRAAAERAKNAQKDIETIDKVLAKLREAIRDQADISIALNISTLQEQANLVKGAITKLITDFNLDPKSKIILKLKADLLDLNMQIKRENIVLPVTLKLENEKVKPLNDAAFKKALKIPSIENIRVASGLAELFSGLPENFFKPFSEKTLKGIADTFNQGFTNIAIDTAVLFGQTLGDALSGQGSIANFFQGIYKSLGSNLQELGKYLIKTAIQIEIIQKTLFSNPFLAIAGGIALIAIGQAIQNSMNRNAFAVGTRNAPGGMALVGERGPELVSLPRGSQVIPAAQTSNMLGGVGGGIEIYGILRGQDIYFSNKKYSATYARTT